MVLRTLQRHPLAAAGLLVGVGAAIAARSESRIDPQGWNPAEPPELTGALAPGDELVDVETVITCDGPEDVAFDDEGRLYAGVENGRILRTVAPVDEATTDAELEAFAATGGRPLGMEFDDEDLLVCAEDAGLLSVSPDGEVTTLCDRAGGREVAFADDLHVADDGTVYFSDATEHDIFQDELFELRDTGRLLAYDLDSGTTSVELSDLGFANGVCAHEDGESILVTETSRYRITRYWIDGDREGDRERFAENLPGYPDNIEAADDGTHWVAIPLVRTDAFDALQGRPWVKRQLGKFPEALFESISIDPYGLVLRLDADGDVVDSLHDPAGDVYGITSATPRDDALYLGSLFTDRVARHRLE